MPVSRIQQDCDSYSQVCGRVAGYQYSGPDAFQPYLNYNTGIDQVYFDGLSIMYGSLRRHIWTYAAGYTYSADSASCLCNNRSTLQLPPFVGSDYYIL